MDPQEKKIEQSDRLISLAVMQTGIAVVRCEEDRQKICKKMCEFAQDDGVRVINDKNGNLCDVCFKN